MIKTLIIKLLKLYKRKERQIPLEIRYGVEKDQSDNRDYTSVGLTFDVTEIPKEYKLPIDPYLYVKNQGFYNSCASHTITTCVEIEHELCQPNRLLPLSERFHYYWVRQSDYMNNFPENAGQTSRQMLRVANKIGICPEKLCPYKLDEMNIKPGGLANGFANLWKVKYYYRIQNIEDAKKVLSKNHPIAVGFMVTDSFRNFKGDITSVDEKKYGGHEVVIYGYDDNKEEFLCINSWGKTYKDNGCMRVPYKYYEKFIIDAWAISI